MLLHDRIAMLTREEVGRDGHNNPIYEDVEHIIPANVQPASSEETYHTVGISTETRYKVTLPANTPEIDRDTGFTYNGRTMEVVGDPKLMKLRGRLHHLEVMMRHL